ncbi:MAG: hypothetical protein HUK05_04205 [Prevotella sp.]|nr:hypothetical protein [Prevotella sp.]MCF0243426.1 hypothetical protein [Bacteroidaceae bacterium]
MNTLPYIGKHELTPLPIHEPMSVPAFRQNMAHDAPYIVTKFQQRSGLGDCIIGLFPPHFVAKIYAFKTSDHRQHVRERDESAREAYMTNKQRAARMGYEAKKKGYRSVKDYIAAEGGANGVPVTYDDEYDEARLTAKVPGLNVYLELQGCLDNCTDDYHHPFRDASFHDYAMAELNNMALWALNNWTRKDRRAMATKSDDEQPVMEWQENYDESQRPPMPPKRGIGVWPNIDASRRPELLHSKAPLCAKDDHEAIMELKAATARAAAGAV